MNTLTRYSLVMVKEDVVNSYIQEVKADRPETIVEMLNSAVQLSQRISEELWAVYVNSKLEVIGIEMISKGGLTSSSTHPSSVFRGAILKGGYGIVLAHNHPSGDPTPSEDDIKSTKQLIEAGKILGVHVVDHVIVGDGKYTSLRLSDAVDFF